MAFQDVGQRRVGLHSEALRLRIQLRLGGRKQQVATSGFELRAVGLQGTRVVVEIFFGPELQTVHKNRRHGHVAQRFGGPHQGQMSGVQIAHGRNHSRMAEGE